MAQYIGKTISLVSNKGLRYVGLLENINANDSTVALRSVRSFGTEGRMAQAGNPNLEVLPGSDIYDSVVFRGSDVKDLSVLDIPIDQVKPEPYYFGPTPTQGQNQPGATSQPTPTNAPAQTTQSPPAVSAQPGHVSAQPSQTSAPAPAPKPAPTATTKSGPSPTTQAPAQPAAVPEPVPKPAKNSPAPAQPQAGPTRKREEKRDDLDDEFDFESANAKFNKQLEADKESAPVYNSKSSFFDNISSSNETRGGMRWNEEKSLNYDTFGEASVHGEDGRRGRGGFRGRGRGRGRGGRARGRGRGKPEPKPEWA